MSRDLYYVYAGCIGFSLLHEGPLPACMATFFYNVLVGLQQDFANSLYDIAHAFPHEKFVAFPHKKFLKTKILKICCNCISIFHV